MELDQLICALQSDRQTEHHPGVVPSCFNPDPLTHNNPT